MKNILFLFLTFNCFSQQKIEIKIVSTTNNLELEDVAIINTNNNKFTYSDKFGKAIILFDNNNDKFKFILPFTKDTIFSIEELKQNSLIAFMEEMTYNLKEVIVKKGSKNKKSDYSYKLKSKKKYYSNFVSNGGAMLSQYIHKKNKKNKLKSLSFFVKNDYLIDKVVKIRPIIKELENNKLIDILITPHTVELNDYEEINIEFDNISFEFQDGKKYFIGFEVIDNSNSNKISILSTSLKKHITYLRKNPNSEFMQLERDSPSFSIYYEIYFSD